MCMNVKKSVAHDIISPSHLCSVADGKPSSPFVHAPIGATPGCQGYLDTPAIIALAVAVRIVRIGQTGEVICQPTRRRRNVFIQRWWRF